MLLLAPMEGVVDPIMRDILTGLGGIDYSATEFIRVTDKLLPPHVFFRYSPELNTEKNKGKTKHQTPVFIQLLGGQPGPMAKNAKLAARLGALGVDINFGCPAKTVNRHDGGAAILKSSERVFNITRAIRASTPKEIPVTVKIRLGFDSSELALENSLAAEEAGAHWLTVHARTKMDGYKPPAKWQALKPIKEKLKIPVIANGDIWTKEDFIRCRETTGCEHFMLGRGIIADPFLAQRILTENNLFSSAEEEWKALKELLKGFITQSAKVSNHFALTRTKQWLRLLGRNYPVAMEFFEKIKRTKSIGSTDELIKQIY